MLEYTQADARIYGVIFEKAMLQTDPDWDMQTRKGQACLKVVEQVLTQLLDGMKDEDDAPESGE